MELFWVVKRLVALDQLGGSFELLENCCDTFKMHLKDKIPQICMELENRVRGNPKMSGKVPFSLIDCVD